MKDLALLICLLADVAAHLGSFAVAGHDASGRQLSSY